MQEKKYGALSSSVNPQELSLTVQSSVKALLSVFVAFGVVQVDMVGPAVQQVGVLVTSGFAFFNAVMVLWGLARKVFERMATR